jgi:transposase
MTSCPRDHPLRVIRTMVNKALARWTSCSPRCTRPTSKVDAPASRPEKLLRAMLLQVLYSVRSERQLMEQTQYNLLFRWFIGLAMDDAVWVPTVFTKNRERLIEHDAVIEFFNDRAASPGAGTALGRALQRGRHPDPGLGGPQELCAQRPPGRRRYRRGQLQRPKAQQRHPRIHHGRDARLYRKGKTASELRFMGHTLTDNRHGLIVSAVVTQADGYAEREAAKAMINDARQALPGDEPITITLGADKGYDAKEFIEALQEMNVLPHVAQNKSGRQSAVPDEIAAAKATPSRSKRES